MKRIAIHSVPRSGSSWLGSIFDSSPHVAYRLQPLFSYTHKGQIGEQANLYEINAFFADIYNTEDEFVLQRDSKLRGIIPRFEKDEISHILYKEVRYHNVLKNLLEKDKELKVIGLIRNPFSVISSWLKAPKEFKKELGWVVDEEWRWAPKKNKGKVEEFNGFEKWKEVVFLFLKLKQKFPEQFYLLEYEDLISNKKVQIEKLFSFSDLEIHEQTLGFLENSSKKNDKDAYSVFKIKKHDEDWKEELPKNIIEDIKGDKEYQILNEKFQWT
ncbi:sulfotransferase domain-containing protein [Tamlana sp. 2_MG-2023]|uniref:sulfotransferase domain-containing protein n=1 Tax=unclassified Tamlana TaxID=2614803 RepID=UPI0026E3C118|nr:MULTISPECIES: sulfotransferase domain-containing protein [unclassified Tamlana]MDO6758740.1 sulfotransferase domain-containing protein [Tamlana sp. 2_MG-2023]MDO6789439.1 sulfotransferase domain-containing protein [Tamlana sp. 1_MG-2023]